jgi:hypothetical protein
VRWRDRSTATRGPRDATRQQSTLAGGPPPASALRRRWRGSAPHGRWVPGPRRSRPRSPVTSCCPTPRSSRPARRRSRRRRRRSGRGSCRWATAGAAGTRSTGSRSCSAPATSSPVGRRTGSCPSCRPSPSVTRSRCRRPGRWCVRHLDAPRALVLELADAPLAWMWSFTLLPVGAGESRGQDAAAGDGPGADRSGSLATRLVVRGRAGRVGPAAARPAGRGPPRHGGGATAAPAPAGRAGRAVDGRGQRKRSMNA